MKRILQIILFSTFSSFTIGQSITLDPKTTATAGIRLDADLAFFKQKRETENGGWPNYPRDNASVLTFTGGGVLSGITDGQKGLLVYVFNGFPTGATTTGELVLKHQSSLSDEVNRIMTPNEGDFPIGNGGVALIYDIDKKRWRVATPEPTGSGGGGTGWGMTGNGGTNPATQFIGTTDTKDFIVKTNNEERLRIDDSNPFITIKGPVLNPTFGQITQNFQKTPAIITERFGGTAAAPTSLQGPTPLFIQEGRAHDGIDIKTYASFGFLTEGNFGDHPGSSGAKGASIGFATRKNKDSNLKDRLNISSEGEISVKGDIEDWGGGRLNIDGTIALSKGSYNHWTSEDYISLNPSKSVFRISGGITYDLKWVDEIPKPADGQLIFIYALSLTTVNIKHNYNVSGATRIITNTGSDVTISDGGGATLIYDAESNYWRVIGLAQ